MMLGIRQVRIPVATSAVTDVQAARPVSDVSLTAFAGASLLREGEGLPGQGPLSSGRNSPRQSEFPSGLATEHKLNRQVGTLSFPTYAGLSNTSYPNNTKL